MLRGRLTYSVAHSDAVAPTPSPAEMQEGTPMAQPTGRDRLLAGVSAAQLATGVAGMVIGLGRC
jgi:hypothetical protein